MSSQMHRWTASKQHASGTFLTVAEAQLRKSDLVTRFIGHLAYIAILPAEHRS